MGERESYIGCAVQAIDAKGRVAIPAMLRAPLEANHGGRSLFIDQHEDESCLVIFDRGWIDLRRAQIASDEAFEREAGRSFDLAMARRNPFATAEPLPYDASGRFVLPPFLRHLAGLTDRAFFNGAIDYVEVWNPDNVLASDRAPARAKRFVEWHNRQKAGK